MRRLITIVVLFFNTLVQSQSLTGTWMGSYHRDSPGNKRMFYYRLYLMHSNDSLYGICEALDVKTDIANQGPEEATVVATYKVFNYQIVQSFNDTNSFTLFVGEAINTDKWASMANIPPHFYKLACTRTVDKDQRAKQQIMYSSLPVNDGSIGQLKVKKISNQLPDLTRFEYQGAWNRSSKEKDVKEAELFSFLRKKKRVKEGQESTEVVSVLTYKERKQELQSTIAVDSSVISIELYDNGVVDNDTVSLYLNDKVVLEKKRVTGNAIHLNIALDASKQNELTLFAHNLGDIAPNTAYMIVKNGTKEHRLFLTASLEKNVVVLFKLK